MLFQKYPQKLKIIILSDYFGAFRLPWRRDVYLAQWILQRVPVTQYASPSYTVLIYNDFCLMIRFP